MKIKLIKFLLLILPLIFFISCNNIKGSHSIKMKGTIIDHIKVKKEEGSFILDYFPDLKEGHYYFLKNNKINLKYIILIYTPSKSDKIDLGYSGEFLLEIDNTYKYKDKTLFVYNFKKYIHDHR